MRAYSFSRSNDDYLYTSSYAVEITDADCPYWGTDGSPKDTPIPTAFKEYETAKELSQAIEEEGELIGEIGCSKLRKFKGKYVVLDQGVVWMVSFRKKGSKKAFMEYKLWNDADWMHVFRK